jgi:biotin synthase-related radical SAM superfamily protein
LTQNLPQIRVSIGTATVLGFQNAKLDAAPTTAYLMTYHMDKCLGNCSFCPQARLSKSKAELLSRVSWPSFSTEEVIWALASAFEQGKIKRVCIQALNYPEVFAHLQALIKEVKKRSAIPVSISCQPINKTNIKLLKEAGAERIGIALDGATKDIFEQVKGDFYHWENQFKLFDEALMIFGEGNVSTHVIIGLGESEKEATEIIQKCVDLGVLPALFAFTPVRGTALELKPAPKLDSYRRVQLAQNMIATGRIKAQNMSFDSRGKITDFGIPKNTLQELINNGTAFQTSGCPDCNRPYYNEKPSGPIYNYPRKLNKEEINKIKANLE